MAAEPAPVAAAPAETAPAAAEPAEVTDEDITALAQMCDLLSNVVLGGTVVTDQGISALKRDSLSNVDRCGTEVTDEGITASKCDPLSNVVRCGTEVTDEGIMASTVSATRCPTSFGAARRSRMRASWP